jgi:transcriptional regulator with XRE-family HTH domain
MVKKLKEKTTDVTSNAVIGERVKQLRLSMDITQSELGALIGNIPHQSIQNVESGKVTRPRYINKLAEVLNTTTAFLLGDNNAATINKAIFKQCMTVVQNVGTDLTPAQQINLVVYLYDECVKNNTEATKSKVESLVSIFT